MNASNSTFLLRLSLAIVLLAHGVPSILSGDVNSFGTDYLNNNGFSPLGLILAWLIKLSHVVAAFCFLFDKYIFPAGLVSLIILIAGIFMIHGEEGWYVVGYGRNGMEFNFVLIAMILTVMYPTGLSRNKFK